MRSRSRTNIFLFNGAANEMDVSPPFAYQIKVDNGEIHLNCAFALESAAFIKEDRFIEPCSESRMQMFLSNVCKIRIQ